MRYREITEAPISDFQVVNKETEKFYNDFDKADAGILNNDKGVQKIMNAFSKTPFEFNIYVIMRPTEGIWAQGFEGSQIEAKEFLKDQLGFEPQTDGRITCVYLSNVTGKQNRMPMNAWTIAHRIIHMLQTAPRPHKPGAFDMLHFERRLWENLVKVADTMTDMKPHFTGSMLGMANPESGMVNFANAIMTQKSARDGRITNSLDVGGEALAQYLLTGAIRFNQAQTVAERFPAHQDLVGERDRERGITHRNQSFSIRPDVDMGLANKMIYAAEKNSMTACRDTLKAMTGNIFWF